MLWNSLIDLVYEETPLVWFLKNLRTSRNRLFSWLCDGDRPVWSAAVHNLPKLAIILRSYKIWHKFTTSPVIIGWILFHVFQSLIYKWGCLVVFSSRGRWWSSWGERRPTRGSPSARLWRTSRCSSNFETALVQSLLSASSADWHIRMTCLNRSRKSYVILNVDFVRDLCWSITVKIFCCTGSRAKTPILTGS